MIESGDDVPLSPSAPGVNDGHNARMGHPESPAASETPFEPSSVRDKDDPVLTASSLLPCPDRNDEAEDALAPLASTTLTRPDSRQTPRLRRRRSSFSVADIPGSEATRSAVVLLASAQIGEGSSGTAFSVANPVDRRRYVMKRVPIHSPAMEAQLCNEPRLHGRLPRHPNIVAYHYSWIERAEDGNGSLCILLEKCKGDLWGLLMDDEGRLTPLLCAKLTLQIASALQEIHDSRIMHRDLSPWNIFVSSEGDARIGDFGQAAEFPQPPTPPTSAAEAATSLPGHLLLRGMEDPPEALPLDSSAIDSIYSAPELGSADGYNEKVDIYSLGMVLLSLWVSGGNGGSRGNPASLVDIIEAARRDPEERLPPLSEATPVLMSPLIKRMIAHDYCRRPDARTVHSTLKKALVPACSKGGGGEATGSRSQSCILA